MTYSYNVPLDWQKVLNEIHHRLTQAYGHLEMIEIRRPKNRIECFYKGENKKLFRFLFNIAITDKIVSISIRQLHEDFTLQLDTEIDCKDTNISPELMEYLVKVLNKADIRMDFNWGIRRIRIRKNNTYNPIDLLDQMCYNIGVMRPIKEKEDDRQKNKIG